MRNEMKARGTLLMALLNKDELKFHSYKEAKLLMEAIEKRYGGNKESKKFQRRLYSSNNMRTFQDQAQKQWIKLLISCKNLLVSWRSKNKVKLKNHQFGDDFTNSNISTNEADNTAYGVSTAHT
ncbi:hypothetical protein Tco_1525603 [Tanacetum coccineum]